jgi:hypothetical protein
VSDPTDDSADTVPEENNSNGVSALVLAAMGSVVLSLYYYYVRGEKQRGQFVGLWPATFLGLGIYMQLKEIKQHLENSE